MAFLCYKRTGRKANNYIDDFFFAALLAVLCNGQVEEFMRICKEINFLIAPEKTEWVMTVIVFLGIPNKFRNTDHFNPHRKEAESIK